MPQNNMPQGYPGQYGNQYGSGQYTYGQYNMLNPVQQLQREGFSFQDNITGNLLQSQLRQMPTGGQVNTTAAPMAGAYDRITQAADVRQDAANPTINVRVVVEGLHGSRTTSPPPTTEPRASSRRQETPGSQTQPTGQGVSGYPGVRYVDPWPGGPSTARAPPRPRMPTGPPNDGTPTKPPGDRSWRHGVLFHGFPLTPERQDSSYQESNTTGETSLAPGSIGLFSTDSERADDWVGQARPTSSTRSRELAGKVYSESELEAQGRRAERARAREELRLAISELPPLRRMNHFERLNRGPRGRVMMLENLALTPEMLSAHSSSEVAGEVAEAGEAEEEAEEEAKKEAKDVTDN